MNQILVSEKVYVTPKLKRKKMFYRIQFVLSIMVVVILSIYCVVCGYDQRQGEAKSKKLLQENSFTNADNTILSNDTLVVALNDNTEPVQQEPVVQQTTNVYKTDSGTEYTVDSILNIPSLGINYPVLSSTSDELLKISLNKFWGGQPNSVGNYCIVGHNYDGKDIFFGKLARIQHGDIVELKDKTGQTLQYKVYDKFIVKPSNTACTSQLTNGKKEMTLITCSDGGKTRLIVKCREI